MANHNLACPNCNHQFCAKCLKENWRRKLGKYSAYGVAEVELACCGCKTVNAARFWTKVAIRKSNDESAKRQIDFFKTDNA